jgi:hypothetical protein
MAQICVIAASDWVVSLHLPIHHLNSNKQLERLGLEKTGSLGAVGIAATVHPMVAVRWPKSVAVTCLIS